LLGRTGFYRLFIELLTVIEKLFDGIDEMELIEKIMSDYAKKILQCSQVEKWNS
jgi:hypothetical protein